MSAATDSNPPGELYCTSCERTFHVGERCPKDGTRLLRIKAQIDPFIGRDLDGRYTVLQKLGQGGMGAVYRAEQHSVDREVAIKVVNAGLVATPDVIKRFLREAKIASKLSHPNAVGVLDFGQTDDGVFYLVMELVAGRTLDEVFKQEGVFRPERVIRIGTQVCDALEGAHALSIIHRDLKPSNLMLLSTGRDLVKVLDFGLAKSVSPDQTAATMTNAGSVVGTPAFMPPELARGEPCDATSDLYSLGAILYLLVSGRLPFMADSVHELLAMHGGDEPAPRLVDVPVALSAVIDRMLRKPRDERFQSADEARLALEEALARPSVPPPMPWDTNPSLGPFPAVSSQFANAPASRVFAAAAAPSRRSQLEVERLISADTMAADSSPSVGLHTVTASPSPKRRRSWPLVALAAAGIAAAVMYLVMRRGTAPASQPPVRPAASMVVTPPVEPRPVEPPPVATPPVATPPVATPPVATPPVSHSKRTPRPVKPKPPKPPPPPTAKPPPPPTTKPPATTTKPPTSLPF